MSLGGGFKNTTNSYWVVQDLNRTGMADDQSQGPVKATQRKASQEAIISDINLAFKEMHLLPDAKGRPG